MHERQQRILLILGITLMLLAGWRVAQLCIRPRIDNPIVSDRGETRNGAQQSLDASDQQDSGRRTARSATRIVTTSGHPISGAMVSWTRLSLPFRDSGESNGGDDS